MHPHLRIEPETETEWFEALVSLARYLRSPQGCPWDREQQGKDFARFAVEEGRELLEAFEKDDRAHIAEEWGDTFFCMIAAAAAAEEEGVFALRDALQGTHEKMIRRHDHVFGERRAETPEDAVESWNRIKEKEKKAKE